MSKDKIERINEPDTEIKNEFLIEEINHLRQCGSEYPVPASDYWMQAKKQVNKEFSCEYLFTLHSISAICGHISVKQLNYVCNKIDKYIKENHKDREII